MYRHEPGRVLAAYPGRVRQHSRAVESKGDLAVPLRMGTGPVHCTMLPYSLFQTLVKTNRHYPIRLGTVTGKERDTGRYFRRF